MSGPRDQASTEGERILDALIRSSSEVRYRLNADWSELRQLAGGDFIPDTTTADRDWIDAYIPAEDRDAVRAELARAIRTKTTYLLEHRVNRVDGTVGWALSRAVPVLDDTGEIAEWFGLASDITDRKHAEAALRDSEARLNASEHYWRSLFERLHEGFMVVEIVRDEQGVARTWRFKEINAAWERISGLDHAAARGRTVDEVIPGIERHWLDTYIGVAETGEPIATRLSLAPLGQLYDVRASRIAPDQVAVLFTEVSAEQRDEVRRAALLDLHDRLRDLDDATEVAQAAADVLGTSLDVGRAAYASVGADGDTLLIERDWTAAGFPSAAGVHRLADYGDAILGTRSGETIVIDDIVADPRTAADTASFEAVAVRALVNVPIIEGGRLVAIILVNDRQPRPWTTEEVGFVRNVAQLTRSAIERRRAEAELRRFADSLEQQVEERTRELANTQAALAQSQKMEAVGQLTGGLAHDFNNLLTAVMGNLELLQARVARGRLDDLDRLVNAAQGAGRRAAALTQRLLAFSRRQTLDPRPTDVNRLVTGLEEMLRRTVGATVDMEIVGAAGLWPADIDAGQLENAILNLCINGRDAMPGGGKLVIETANKWLDERVGRERDLPPGQYISVCVTDTGTGMSAEVVERAFEPFYTTKPIGMGTGLGLSMIYGFARQSGGQVRIYSEVGQGTTVCIYLPRHHGEAAAEEVEPAVELLAKATGQTVLVVDDEAAIRHLIDEVLDDLGYTVIGAADGSAGLKVLQSGARIDLLITDVGLPNGMNGRQVADAARALRPGLKVLFITGFAENAAVGNGHLEPGMELLTKPFTLESLASKTAEMMKSSG